MSGSKQSNFGKRVIVVAVDGSENAMTSFQWYLDEMHRGDDYVVVVHVPEVQTLPLISFKKGLSLPVDQWQKVMQDQLNKVNEILEKYESVLVGKKIIHKLLSENNSSPGQGIIGVAEKEGARVIVVGTRGLDLLRRTVLGSVSDYIVHHSRIPVLVCPKND